MKKESYDSNLHKMIQASYPAPCRPGFKEALLAQLADNLAKQAIQPAGQWQTPLFWTMTAVAAILAAGGIWYAAQATRGPAPTPLDALAPDVPSERVSPGAHPEGAPKALRGATGGDARPGERATNAASGGGWKTEGDAGGSRRHSH